MRLSTFPLQKRPCGRQSNWAAAVSGGDCPLPFRLNLNISQREVTHRTQKGSALTFSLFVLFYSLFINPSNFPSLSVGLSEELSLRPFLFSNYIHYRCQLTWSTDFKSMCMTLNSNFVFTSFLHARAIHQVPVLLYSCMATKVIECLGIIREKNTKKDIVATLKNTLVIHSIHFIYVETNNIILHNLHDRKWFFYSLHP